MMHAGQGNFQSAACPAGIGCHSIPRALLHYQILQCIGTRFAYCLYFVDTSASHSVLVQGLVALNLETGLKTLLTNHVDDVASFGNTSEIVYANDLDIASDGTIYFSDSSVVAPLRSDDGKCDTYAAFMKTYYHVSSESSPHADKVLPDEHMRWDHLQSMAQCTIPLLANVFTLILEAASPALAVPQESTCQ